MDKELYDLKNWAIETLKEYKAELLITKQVTGKAPSALKKADRFLNALAVDTSGTYADMIDDARRKGISQKEFANMGRNLEERIMNSFRVLPDDPAHHMYSLRTAGDLIQNVEPGVREMGLQILKDEGYILGNVRENLTSLAEATHQGRTGKGAELAALGEISVDKTQTAIAHPRGTGDPLISRTIDYKNIKTPEDFANAYRPLLEQQSADLAGALETEAPRRKIITEYVEEQRGPKNIFGTSVPAPEVKRGRDIIKKAPGVMQRAYRAMPIIENGSFRLSFGLDEALDAIKGNPLGAVMGAAAAIQPEAVTQALQGDVSQAVQTTSVGAGLGAAIQQTLTKAPVIDKVRAASVLGRAPSLLKFGGGVAKFLAGPIGAAYTAYELSDAVVEGVTGRKIHQHTKDELSKTQEKDPEYFSSNIGSIMPF